MKSLSNADDCEAARQRLDECLKARGEWFCEELSAARSNARVSLRQGEWELSARRGGLHFAYWSEAGARAWRVAAWQCAEDGQQVRLDVTRRAGAERATLELIARATIADARAELLAARQQACAELAARVCRMLPGSRVERARLSAGARRAEPGRYARVLLRRGHELIAVTGAVVGLRAHELGTVLASALVWWLRSQGSAQRRDARPCQLWLVVEPELTVAAGERLALLRVEIRGEVKLCETRDEADNAGLVIGAIDSAGKEVRAKPRRSKVEAADEVVTLDGRAALGVEAAECVPVIAPTLDELLARAPRVQRPVFEVELSEMAARIAAFAPDAVDMVRARHGETLRYHGLAFARVRRVLEHEQVWFGVQGAASTTGAVDAQSHRGGGAVGRHLLNDETWPELARLLDELAMHRRATANDRRHLLYRSAPEAWLESLLRRDITRLDPGLRLAPLHAQFRATRDTTGGGHARPIDLLALRQDGRLAVIELKVAEDAALPLQGADYWRRVSAHHRAGHIARARLFGDAVISDEPVLVYLVAPLLRFHRSFQALARMITPEIEMYRFDINEDWRAGVRVARRLRVN